MDNNNEDFLNFFVWCLSGMIFFEREEICGGYQSDFNSFFFVFYGFMLFLIYIFLGYLILGFFYGYLGLLFLF